jgi:hypothetical protein
MGTTPSSAMRLFGTEEPVPETPLLQAGPLEASFDAGNLRHIRIAGREAIRAISYIVRDRNWATYAPKITHLHIEQDAAGFRVRYDAVCRDGQQQLAYRAAIAADSHGNLSFEAEGVALTDFVTNRTGFVVLHPLAGVSGAAVEVLHVGGAVEQSRFPELIDPTCPFKDIRALTHEILPDVRVVCRMEGDAFEMEDQRNWLDASYKTYVRPLTLPWPYTIRQGERFMQKVTLSIEGLPPAAAAGADEPVTVTVGEATGATMPAVGLAVPAEHVRAALEQAVLLRAAGPAYLMAEFDARKGHDAGLVQDYGELAHRIGAELVLEVVLPCLDAAGMPTDDLDVLRRDLRYVQGQIERVGVRPARIAVSPACDLKCTLPGGVWPKAPAWETLAAESHASFPGIPIGGGMFSYFTELNRKRPPEGLFDFVGHSVCPLVHAGDDLSLTEGLEALPHILASTRAFIGDAPYWLYPSAIAMRANPYGAAPAENPQHGRVAMARVDPREGALIGAAWYAGLLAHAGRAGLEAVTLAAVAGPSGVLAPSDGEARLRPSFHVIRGHAARRGAAILNTRSTAPRDVQSLAVRCGTGLHLWLSNLSGRPQSVRLDGPGWQTASVSLIDEARFGHLAREPDGVAGSARPLGAGALTLPPYAVAAITA